MDNLWLVIPLLTTASILLTIGGYSLRFRSISAAGPFTVFMFLGAAWASAHAFGMIDANFADKIFLLKMRASLQLFIPLAMFATALEHARLNKWLLKSWPKLLLFPVPLVLLLVIWNDKLFSGMFYNLHLSPDSAVLQFQYGPWIWVLLAYIGTLEIGILITFAYALKNSQGIYFRQTLSLALALIIPEAVYLIVGLMQIGPNSIAPNSLLLTGIFSAWALFRYQWLSIAPTARNLAVNNMNDALIVLDIEDCIVDFNQAAQNFFTISEHSIGQPIEKSIPQWKKLPYPANKTPLRDEFELDQQGQKYHFEVIVNQVEDQHNQPTGHVIILREFTQRRKTDHELKKHIKELEVINTISVHISSQLDMDNLIRLIGQKLEEIFNVHSVFVALYDSQSRLIKLPYWTINHKHIETAPLKLGRNLTSIILQTKQSILIAENFEETSKKLEVTLRFAGHFGYPKTWLGVPIIVRDEVIGVIGVQDYEKEHAFNEDETRLLQTIATNLGIAIQNASLYQEARHRAEQMSSLYNVGLTLTANLEFNQVLRQLFESCRQILPMDIFYVAIYDENSQTISHPLFYENDTEKTVPIRDINVSPGLSGEIILNHKTIYLSDASKRQIRKIHHIIRAGGRPSRSYVGAPMIVSGRVVGVISMQSYEPNAYSQEQIRLLETIANVAGVAIENSRLFEQAQADIEERRLAQESLLNANQDLHIQLNKVKALQRELREQAIRDPLTGLHNRRFLNSVLPQRIEQAAQRGAQLSILMIDIDRFKTFNDSYGHHAGDALLQSLAGLLRRHTRSLDIACRYGGEEFLLVLSNTSLEIASRRAEELREAFDQSENKFGDQILHATISIGVAAFPTHGTGIEELIMQADQALYAAKAGGRNKVIVWKY
jgi:diguanylate cyclase (GGDEF)-like protein